MEREDLLKEAEFLLCDVGYEQFNKDHKELVYHMLLLKELLEKIAVKGETDEGWKTIKQIINMQVERSKVHFAAEEELMEKANFAALAEHKNEHIKIVAELTSIKKCIDDQQNIKYAHDLQSLFLSWIFQHSCNVDMEYKGKL
ncbi:MAG: hemerythrin domain-containing protein [Magnetococcales bacterium]|nr:hemerythrin domain-containing protein [Magnetococcales bacterium]